MPTISIKNQKPVTIYNPDHMLSTINPTINSIDYNIELEKTIDKQIVEPLYTPNIVGTDVTITDVSDPTSLKTINKSQIVDALLDLWTNGVSDPELDEQIDEIYRQSLLNYQNNNWTIEQQLAIEAMSSVTPKLPVPGMSNFIINYTANGDLIPTAKSLLAKSDPYSKTMWFASLAGYLSQKTVANALIVTFQSTTAFDMYKTMTQQLINTINSGHNINATTNKLFADLNKITLDGLSETVMLPKDRIENDQENSFVRLFMNSLSIFEANHNDLFCTQPINMAQLFLPEVVIMLNLEEYAHATAKEINKDWADIAQAMAMNTAMKFVTNKQLTTAQSINAATQKQQRTKDQITKNNQIMRMRQRPFSGKPVPSKSVLKAMQFVAKNSMTDKKTQNIYKIQSQSFMRPNRRNPDDPNLMGKITTIKYRPDIHLYIDTSGSISEPQYRDSVVNSITLAKKLDANLFITSFSHVVSATSLLKTQGRSIAQIYADFLNIPKVTGGTDYMNVWKKIEQIDKMNKKTGASYQLNFIISDFEYNLPRGHRFDPKSPCISNTYYAPISTNKQTWSSIVYYAKSFVKQMAKANDPNIRARMLL